MKFDAPPPLPSEKYKHRITFETHDEALATWSAYRERVVLRTANGLPLEDHELDLSEFWGEEGSGILTNYPEAVAATLDDFHQKTESATIAIARKIEVAYSSDDIARRVRLGNIAKELANLIRGNHMADILLREIETQARPPALLTEGDGPAPNPET